MTATEDLFTPIHKGIRAMIYDLGGRMQSNDFTDLEASKALLSDLQHEFSAAMSTGCILCVIHAHAGDEESGAFPEIAKIDPDMIRTFIDEHHAFSRRLESIAALTRELPDRATPEERVAVGIALNQAVNSFFAVYLDHMNREETQIVPFMKEHYTDEQMRTMRSTVMASISRERLIAVFRWMLPSLNVTEMSGMLAGLVRGAPPPLVQLVLGIATETVPADRLAAVKKRVGLPA